MIQNGSGQRFSIIIRRVREMEYIDAVKARRSEYVLDSDIDVDAVVDRITEVAGAVPSAFNSQSTRLFVLTGDEHHRFWGIVEARLRAKVADDAKFAVTKAKLDGFAAAAGTILFYEVDSVPRELAEKYPSYAAMFPQWAEHADGMMQFAVWTAIRDMGYGANIQHYNPLVDADAAEAFGIPDGYRLIAQMVFGRVVEPAGPKEKLPGTHLVVRVDKKV